MPDGLAIDAATTEVLLSGGHYINVHSEQYPSGELRGQVIGAAMKFGPSHSTANKFQQFRPPPRVRDIA